MEITRVQRKLDVQHRLAQIELQDLTLHFDRTNQHPDLIGGELARIAARQRFEFFRHRRVLIGRGLQAQARFAPSRREHVIIVKFGHIIAKIGEHQTQPRHVAHAGVRLQAATDQHAAMTEELESLARSDPREFTPDQIWVLIRAIKVQGQILQLYLGEPVLDA